MVDIKELQERRDIELRRILSMTQCVFDEDSRCNVPKDISCAKADCPTWRKKFGDLEVR